MQLRIFTLPFDPVIERFDDSVVTSFIADKDVLSIRDHFFTKDGVPYLTIVICYRVAPLPSPPAEAAKPVRKRDESWRQALTETDWPLFNTLRAWRMEQSRQAGVPPYVICNNKQLAEVVKARPKTLADLGRIEGFGEGKLKKYGDALVALLAGDSSANQEPKRV